MAHSDSVSPTSLEMQLKLCQQCELKSFQTGFCQMFRANPPSVFQSPRTTVIVEVPQWNEGVLSSIAAKDSKKAGHSELSA